jgi:cohesin loading factor subunit SCC2
MGLLRFNAKRIDLVSEIISVSQVLKNAFEPTLNIIINCLDASAVFMRTKGLRALGEVILEDPTILRNVRGS